MIEIKAQIAIKAKNHLNSHGKIEKSGQILRDQDKAIRRKRVTLPESSRRRDPISRHIINDQSEGGRTNPIMNPAYPSTKEIRFEKDGENCSPAQGVISLFNI